MDATVMAGLVGAGAALIGAGIGAGTSVLIERRRARETRSRPTGPPSELPVPTSQRRLRASGRTVTRCQQLQAPSSS